MFSRDFVLSWLRNMTDWKSLVRGRLGPLPVDPARAADIVDELAQHIAAHYKDLVASRNRRRDGARPRALAPLAIVRRGGDCTRQSPSWCPSQPGAAGRQRRRVRRPWPAASATPRVSSWAAPAFTNRGPCPDARARHRREHRDLQRGQRRAAAAAPVRGRQPALRSSVSAVQTGPARQCRLHDISRLARAEPCVRRDGADSIVAGRPTLAIGWRRARARGRHAGVGELLRAGRHASGDRPRVPRRRGRTRQLAGY